MTSERAPEAIALAATLMLAAASWVVVTRQTNGMDMGVSTELGSFPNFTGYWVPISYWRRSFCLSIELSTCRSHWPSWRLVLPLPPTSDEGDETNDEAQGRNT
jgi:hypothetical protein